MTTIKQLYHEFKEINKKSVYDNQAQLDFPKGEENPFEIAVTLTPQYGPFKHGKIVFDITLPKDYPENKPTITCRTKIYHPNISFAGTICFSMLSSDWSKDYRLEHYINGLLFLLANPNHESPLNSSCVDKKSDEYELNVQMALAGFPVKGQSFPKSTATENICFSEPTMLRYLYRGAFNKSSNQKALLTDIYKDFTESVLQSPSFAFLKSLGIHGYIRKWKDTSMTAHKVLRRAKLMEVDTKFVLKELLWKVDDKNVLIISNGLDRIDETALAKELHCKECTITNPDEVSNILTGLSRHSLPVFCVAEKVDEIIVNQTILDLDDSSELVMASGCTGILMSMPKSNFVKLLDNVPTKIKRLFLPVKIEDGVADVCSKTEKLSVQPN